MAPEGLGYPGYGLDEDFNMGVGKAICKIFFVCVCVFFGHGKKVTMMMMMMMMMMMQCLPHAHLFFFFCPHFVLANFELLNVPMLIISLQNGHHIGSPYIY